MKSHLLDSAMAVRGLSRGGAHPSLPYHLRRLIPFSWLGPHCRFTEAVDDHSHYVSQLMETGLHDRAADHLYLLSSFPTAWWPARTSDALVVITDRFARANKLEPFHVEAWWNHRSVLHLRGDPHAKAYTLLDGAAVAWHYALVENPQWDDEAAVIRAVSDALTTLGLPPPPRDAAIPLETWAWNAPNDALNAAAAAFAARPTLTRDDPQLEALNRGRYAVEVFRKALQSLPK